MVHAVAVLADPPPGQPVEDDLARHVEVDHEVERIAVEHAVELLGLMHRAREAVEYEAVVERATGREALLDDADHDVVGNEFALVHEALGLEPECSALRGLLAEHVAGRQVRDAVMLRETRSLRPLAGTLLAEQHQLRLRIEVAQDRNPS